MQPFRGSSLHLSIYAFNSLQQSFCKPAFENLEICKLLQVYNTNKLKTSTELEDENVTYYLIRHETLESAHQDNTIVKENLK